MYAAAVHCVIHVSHLHECQFICSSTLHNLQAIFTGVLPARKANLRSAWNYRRAVLQKDLVYNPGGIYSYSDNSIRFTRMTPADLKKLLPSKN